MWKIALLMYLSQLTYVLSKPPGTIEGPLWHFKEVSLFKPSQLEFSHLFKQRVEPLKTYDEIFQQTNERNFQEKRAFSILARLRPFSDIGKQRTSIRQISRGPLPLAPMPDLDIVSAETRALLRPGGQPLRWG